MFAPKNQQITELTEQQAFIKQHSFGVLVSPSLCATHLPFILNKEQGEMGVLTSHLARVNPHLKTLQGSEVMVIFNGPHSYISPTWYCKHPAVPTWNYAAVHAYGKVSLLNSEETLRSVKRAIQVYEPKLQGNEEVLPASTITKMLNGIVGISVNLTRIEGVNKLGQHKSNTDQQKVFQTLSSSKHLGEQSLAQYMHSINLGKGQ